MTPHKCRTDDGASILCLCIRGQDHDERFYDVPAEVPQRYHTTVHLMPGLSPTVDRLHTYPDDDPIASVDVMDGFTIQSHDPAALRALARILEAAADQLHPARSTP